MPGPNDARTADRILDVAEALAQTRGFNGFSYAHIATRLGITKASLHYHFRGKAELGEALIARYAARFADALGAIDDREGDARDKLIRLPGLYSGVMDGGRMCLCGMLAAEYETLPRPMAEAIVRFFDANHAWIVRVLSAGRADGTLEFAETPARAQTILGGLEGALLVARPYGIPHASIAPPTCLLAPFARTR